MTDEKRVPLYARLPEIYRTKDAEAAAPCQLQSYLALVEEAFGHIHENIEALYHDLFVETCADWVVPYIGDLLGTSHLSGDPRTVRADVADTIALRRRKGTLGAVELLAYSLTGWGAQCTELRENLAWNQHLNHQRPDEGGLPPYGLKTVKRQTVIRGGTATLRDPAMLALLRTPFDPYAYTADVKAPAVGQIRYNLPNLAIFLWRLAAYRVGVSRPVFVGFGPTIPTDPPSPPDGVIPVRFNVNPLARPYAPPGAQQARQPVRLFNTHRFDLYNSRRGGTDKLDLSRMSFDLSLIDEVPGPIPLERLNEGAEAGVPEKYLSVETYDQSSPKLDRLDISDVGLQLHLPESNFAGEQWPVPQNPALAWKVRGANLCAWESGLKPELADKEIVVDPVRGRVLIGVKHVGAGGDPQPRAEALRDQMLVTYTYAAPGPVGAHTGSRAPAAGKFAAGQTPIFHRVLLRLPPGSKSLHDALQNIHVAPKPTVIEIDDSFTHTLDLGDLSFVGQETTTEAGGPSLKLNYSLLIRAASNQRPVIKLQRPLSFRPTQVRANPPTDAAQQAEIDGRVSELTVRLEGLFITRGEGFPAGEPLISRAAVGRLELVDCTLDPEGFVPYGPFTPLPPAPAPVLVSVKLQEPYGFQLPEDEDAFKETPEVVIQRTITGPLLIKDTGYTLDITDSVVDAGQGVGDATDAYAISGAVNASSDWGPPTTVNGVTLFGRTRVESITGRGAVFVHALEARDVQKGCLKYCYFSGERKTAAPFDPVDRLPQNHACVRGLAPDPADSAHLQFTSEHFGDPGYAQLAFATDFRVRERGPGDDQMGAYGFLLEAHKWRNLQIRFREFMPVGVRALLIPVT